MPTTPVLALPYPALSAAPNVPADVQALADRLEAVLGTAWTVYSPALTASVTNPGLGTGNTANGRYKKVGLTVHFDAAIRFGTGMAAGAGTYFVSLPVPAAASWDIGGGNGRDLGSGSITDDSAGINTLVGVRFSSATTVQMPVSGGGYVNSATIAWAVSDFACRIAGTYEAAA